MKFTNHDNQFWANVQISTGLIKTIYIRCFTDAFPFYTPSDQVRKARYLIVAALILVGIFFMRWNVVIGGQLFLKSFYGYTSFKIGLIGAACYLMAAVWLIVPFAILSFRLWLLPPWKKKEDEQMPPGGAALRKPVG